MDEKGLKESPDNAINRKLEKNLFPFTGSNMQLSVKNKPALEQTVLFPNTWVSRNNVY